MTVRGKTIMITGAAGGLGSQMARTMCRAGAIVYLLDLDGAGGTALEKELRGVGGQAFFVRTDVTSEADWQAAVDDALEQTGRLDALVNNAGINIRKPIEQMSMEEWMKMMQVNTGSVFLGCKLAIPVMRAQGGGSIINMSSVCGLLGHRYTPEAYTATKGAVSLLTKSVASRYGKDGIRCNAVNPSTVDTPLVQELFKDPQRKAERIGEVPLGRLATAQDVANAVMFLASEEASFINGVLLPVDGGVSCD